MPTRVLRDSSKPARKRGGPIAFALRQAIWAMPCAVCGVPYNINVDHIVPVAKGGTSDPKNLQPLCHTCNHIKGCRLDNDAIATVIASRGYEHFLRAVFNHYTRALNPYDKPSVSQWCVAHPEGARQATELFVAFQSRLSHA